jgi:hypothetical protein
LAFFKEKNPTLEKPQEIIDFFLDEFWWRHKFGNNPVLDRQSSSILKPEKKEPTEKQSKNDMPDPNKDKAGYLKWLKEN